MLAMGISRQGQLCSQRRVLAWTTSQVSPAADTETPAFFGEAVLMMELPKRYSTPLEGGAGSHPLIVLQTLVGVH